MEENYGTVKSIPQMILAGASCDDIYVIVLFSTFSTMAQGGSAHVKDFINIPVSIVLGIVLGSVTGYLLSLFFETAYAEGDAKSSEQQGGEDHSQGCRTCFQGIADIYGCTHKYKKQDFSSQPQLSEFLGKTGGDGRGTLQL